MEWRFARSGSGPPHSSGCGAASWQKLRKTRRRSRGSKPHLKFPEREKEKTMAVAKPAARLTTEDLTLSIAEEIHVRASIDKTFEALLEQLGPLNENPNGAMPMK